MSHIYIDGTKITANANKGNDQLLTGYNIQQCKQKNHRDSLFRESRLFNMLFLYSTFCGADDGNRTTRSAWKAEVLPLNYIRLSM